MDIGGDNLDKLYALMKEKKELLSELMEVEITLLHEKLKNAGDDIDTSDIRDALLSKKSELLQVSNDKDVQETLLESVQMSHATAQCTIKATSEDKTGIINENSKRKVLFSPYEKEVLFGLVLQFKETIENKETNGRTWREKSACWSKIAELFNATAGVTLRTAKQLQFCYKNGKKNAMKKLADQRVEVHRTGGGISQAATLTPFEESIAAMNVLPAPIPNEFDSDAGYRVQMESEQGDHSFLPPSSPPPACSPEVTPSQNIRNTKTSTQVPSASASSMPPSRFLHVRRRPRQTRDSSCYSSAAACMEAAAQQKVELLKDQRVQQQREHEARMAEHKVRMSILRKQLEMLENKELCVHCLPKNM